MESPHLRVVWMLLRVVCLVLAVTEAFFFSDPGTGTGDSSAWKSLIENLFQGEITPVDPYILVGGTVNLTCTLKSSYDGNLNASYMFFTHKEENSTTKVLVPIEYQSVIDQDTLRLELPDATRNMTGWYYCTMEPDQNLHQTTVHVTDPPNKIENLSCISNNNRDMTCEFCDEAIRGVTYEIHWKIGIAVRNGTCQRYSFVNETRCVCRFCQNTSIEGCEGEHDYFPPSTYNITVVSRLPKLDNVYASFNVTTTFSDRVKPDPPALLSVMAGNRSLAVTWSPPSGLENSNIFPLHYQLSYHSAEGALIVMDLYSDLSVEIADLHPYTTYTIQVRTRPVNGSYWSDYAAAESTTFQDVPAIGPPLTQGCFRSQPSTPDDLRKVTVFWGEIPIHDLYGELQYFEIEYFDVESNDSQDLKVHQDDYYKTLMLSRHRAYMVYVTAVTVGKGPSSLMYIPKQSQLLPEPSLIEAELNDDMTEVTFYVDPPNDVEVTSYTLLYCTEVNDDAMRCQGPSTAMVFSANETEFTVMNHVGNRVYALSVNSGEFTSGLPPYWQCVYKFDGAPGKPDLEVPPAQEERSLLVRWQHLLCDEQSTRGRVSHYRVSHKPTSSDSNATFHKVNASIGYIEFTLTDLLPYSEYELGLQACTPRTCGDVDISSHTTEQSAPEDPPQDVVIETYTSSEVTLSWKPPEQPNGVLHTNFIKNAVTGEEITYKNVSGDVTSTTVTGLPGYVNHSVRVIAQNQADVSPSSDPQYFFTPPRGPPSVDVKLKSFSNGTVTLEWMPPQPSNGPLHYYLVTWTQDGSTWRNITQTKAFYSVPVKCQKTAVNFTAQVTAVNKAGGKEYPGEPSSLQSIEVCSNKNESYTEIIVPVATVLGVLIILAFIVVLKCRRNTKKMPPAPIIPEVDKDIEKYISQSPEDEITKSSGYTTMNGDGDGEDDRDSGHATNSSRSRSDTEESAEPSSSSDSGQTLSDPLSSDTPTEGSDSMKTSKPISTYSQACVENKPHKKRNDLNIEMKICTIDGNDFDKPVPAECQETPMPEIVKSGQSLGSGVSWLPRNSSNNRPNPGTIPEVKPSCFDGYL